MLTYACTASQGELRRRCKYWDVLHPVFGDRTTSHPVFTTDNLDLSAPVLPVGRKGWQLRAPLQERDQTLSQPVDFNESSDDDISGLVGDSGHDSANSRGHRTEETLNRGNEIAPYAVGLFPRLNYLADHLK